MAFRRQSDGIPQAIAMAFRRQSDGIPQAIGWHSAGNRDGIPQATHPTWQSFIGTTCENNAMRHLAQLFESLTARTGSGTHSRTGSGTHSETDH